MITIPRLGTCHPEVHLKPRRKAVALAYLRAAHAYMLISMPTGTSTIFGVFQAILALSFFNFFSRTDSILGDKLVRNEKFASEISFKLVLIPYRLCCTAKEIHVLCGGLPALIDQMDALSARVGFS